MGAQAEMQIHHSDRKEGERLITLAVAEIRRLERQFSLFSDQSALLALNRRGALEAPSPDFVTLLAQSVHFNRITEGLFDPTVQPLWNLYQSHFAQKEADQSGPHQEKVSAALELIGMQHVAFNEDRVAFSKRGMALTFNGVGQGYITDKVVALLRENGIERSLIDLGETRAIGPRPDNSPWRIGIADPTRYGATLATLPLINRAIATSGGYGFRFDAEGHFNHIFDPRTGLSASRYASVSILHNDATSADALATAACLLPLDKIAALVNAETGSEAHIVHHNGQIEIIRG